MSKKNEKSPKSVVVNVRCTPQQKAALVSVAAKEGLGVSTWVLHVSLLAAQDRKTKGASK